MTVTRAPAQWSHMRPGPRHHHTSSATMWQYVTIPRVCGDHCSCNVTCSINMFYPVLINTHTRWHRTRVTRIWGMSHTAHILSTTFFGDRGHWQLWPVHQTCIRPQWWQHFLGFWWWRAGLIRESWTKNFLWGDNPGWQARAGNCLPTFLTAASLPSFLPPGWRHAFKDPDDIIFSCHHHLDPVWWRGVAICCLMPAGCVQCC